MNRTCLTIPLLLAGFPFTALPAQDNVVYPPPTPPLVAPVPENAAWSLSVADGNKPTPQPSQPTGSQANTKNPGLREIRVTKTGNLKRDIGAFGSGTTLEIWYADGVLIATDSNQRPTVSNYKGLESHYGNGLNATESAGFTGLDWLDVKHYDQVVLYQGQPCYHYGIKTKQARPPNVSPETPDTTLSAEAWINAKTGLPVAYTTGDGKLYTYRFLDPPTTPLSLPPAYQSALAVYEKDQDKRKLLDEAAAASIRP